MTYTSAHAVGIADRVARYKLWKEQHVPLVYDWLSSRQLAWPHGAVQWGAPKYGADTDLAAYDRLPGQRRSDRLANTSSTRSIFLAERTNNTPGDPNTLLHYDVRVVHELVNKPADIAKPWVDDNTLGDRDTSSKDFTLRKRLIHPGEVNRIRVLSPSLVITQTDSPDLYLWNLPQQPDRKRSERSPNEPTCKLTGHVKNAEFAIDIFNPPQQQQQSPQAQAQPQPQIHPQQQTQPSVLQNPQQQIQKQISGSGGSFTTPDISVVSGGADHNVCLWRLRDYEALSGALKAGTVFHGSHAAGPGVAEGQRGHSSVVEDVSFRKDDGGGNIIVSVGRDSALILWDARAPNTPAEKVCRAHSRDINCCDFGGNGGAYIISGGTEGSVHLWDMRRLRSPTGSAEPVRALHGHRKQITSLAWNRFDASVFASGAEDGEILVWNLRNTVAGKEEGKEMTCELPDRVKQEDLSHSPELMFRHVGHNHTDSRITDLDWMPTAADKWCMASLSESDSGGSRLQIWRMSDLIYRSKDEVMDELQLYSDKVLG